MDVMALRATLKGHGGAVTAITSTPDAPDILLSSSRDKSVMVWKLTREDGSCAYPLRALRGHNHYVQDVVISSDGQFALSSSWDSTLRLWELSTGSTTRTFIGHTKDVLSVAFSSDNRQIVSGSRDRSIKLWNTLGQCKHTIADSHNDWVSCVRFSPNASNPIFVSVGWDKNVNIWNLANCSHVSTLREHTGYINAITISPDGSICASGGKDGNAIIWDVNEKASLYSLNVGSVINTLCFSPKRYWLCTGTETGVQIIDLESKTKIADLNHTFLDYKSKNQESTCTSLAWSPDGTDLYAGYTDGCIRVWSTLSAY